MGEKLCISLLCVLLCSACGQALCASLARRRELLEALGRDLRSIRGHICFERLPIGEAFARLEGSPLYPLWKEAALQCAAGGAQAGFAELWQRCVGAQRKLLLAPLHAEDMDILLDFGARLGSLAQTKEQERQTEHALEGLARCALEAKEEMQKKGRLFQSLSTMAGLAIAIVLW